MTNKILVTYATCTGSTVGVAEAIGKTLAEQGLIVDVLPMQAVKDLSAYQAVVAGSAIQDKRWLPRNPPGNYPPGRKGGQGHLL